MPSSTQVTWAANVASHPDRQCSHRQSSCLPETDISILENIMEETGVDAFDSRLLNSIFLLTEGRDVARLRLVCKEWQQKIDDAQVEAR